MVLIEGLGDEVTLVLGSFLLVVVLLFAWLSTHTDDIPLIREVGVIVVELRQRHRNRQQNRSDQQAPQEVEISQSSREGLLNSTDTARVEESDSVAASYDLRQQVNISESGTSQSSSSSVVTQPSRDHHRGGRDGEVEVEGTDRVEMESSNGVLEPSFTSVPASIEESVIIPSQSSPPVHLSKEINEETLRRRRVEYFQSGGVSEDNNHDNVSGDGIHGNNQSGAQRLGENVHSIFSNVADNNSDSRKNNVPTGASDCDNISSSKVEPELSVPCNSETRGLHRQSTDLDAAADAQSPGPQRDSHIDSDISNGQQQRNSQGIVTNDNVNDDDNGAFLEGSRIRVKLKYMNETQRFVYASPEDTIGDFRRTHFQSELQDNKWVRFIFNGQDLRDDARTLQACNIENNCTMHCLVTTRHQPGDRQRDILADEEEESIFGTMMYPLFTVMLMIVWYFRIFYRQYFSAMSTVCLIGISFLLALSYVSSIRNINAAAAATTTNSQQQQQSRQQHPPSASQAGRTNHPHSD